MRFIILICILQLVISGGISASWAQSPSRWHIPIIIQPKQGVYTFSLPGAQLNSVIKPLERSKLSANKPVKISFQKQSIQHYITLKSVPGVVQNHNHTQSSQVFLVKGWLIRITNLKEAKAYLKSKEDVSLIREENSCYKLPPSKTFTVEIYANDLQGELLLPPNSFPQDNNPIRLKQVKAAAGGQIEYCLRPETMARNNSKLTILFLSEYTQKVTRVASLDVEPKQDAHGLCGMAVLPESEAFEFWFRPKTIKSIALITDEAGRAYIKINNINVTDRKAGIVLGLLVVALFLGIVRWAKSTPFLQEKDRERYERWKNLSLLERAY